MNKTSEYTPNDIRWLKDNEIYCFESNKLGKHVRGNQKIAYDRFGAEWGIGEGHVGQSYAIPTLDEHIERVSERELKEILDRFVAYVDNHSEYKFYLTHIGTIAGFKIDTVKRILRDALREISPDPEWAMFPANLIIPQEFASSDK